MIRAVFFDWFYTLARFEPARERLYDEAFRECGLEVPLDKIMRGVLRGDQLFFEENGRSPVAKRSPEEQIAFYVRYPEAMLAEAGREAPRETCVKVVQRVRERFVGATFALFDDVLPGLRALKGRGLIIGLLTNIDRQMGTICEALGLAPYLDLVITSKEVGADKPQPPIFLVALKRAGVRPEEALYVGDQYRIDVLGARGVGMIPVLIDRYDIFPEVSDCPRIHRLDELAACL